MSRINIIEHTKPEVPGEPAARATTKRRIRKLPKKTQIDRDIDHVRANMHWVFMESKEANSLSAQAEIVLGISQMLYNMIRLADTHEVLKAAGEPLADLLERRMRSLADEMKMRLAHPDAVFLGDLTD